MPWKSGWKSTFPHDMVPPATIAVRYWDGALLSSAFALQANAAEEFIVIAAKLVALIEIHSSRLTADIVKDLFTNERTPGFRAVRPQDLEHRIVQLLNRLGNWIGEPRSEKTRTEFTDWGRRRFDQGIPLSELIYAVIVIKQHLRRYISDNGLVDEAFPRMEGDYVLPLHLQSLTISTCWSASSSTRRCTTSPSATKNACAARARNRRAAQTDHLATRRFAPRFTIGAMPEFHSTVSNIADGGMTRVKPRYPSIFQINTRVWLTDLARRLGRPVTLDDIPDNDLDRLARQGFDWIWLLSVWQTGSAAQRVSRSNPEWRAEFQDTLPDLQDEDIAGSGFAITGYTVHESLGGDDALARVRGRLRDRGLRLMLDFVPNHMAPDHPWVESHPEYFVQGTEADLQREPQNYARIGQRVLAYGRDPYFSGWPDTVQLDYSNPATRQAMAGELARIAGQCDGVRCDMAMLVLPDVFERTWGPRPESFWSPTITQVRDAVPGFCFMAEVYWDLEWTMQHEGFDYAYDKRLYDRLREKHARPVREHFHAGLDYQDKLARFLENHDEPRASSVFERDVHEAAAVVTFLSPGLRFFHQGEFEGRKKRISPHLVRAPQEPRDESLEQFYGRLLSVLRRESVRDGQWQLNECVPAWDGNPTADGFLAFSWRGATVADQLLVVVNYAGNQGQCYVRLPFPELAGRAVRFSDLMSPASYDREGSDVASNGLYLDLPPWGYHVFEVRSN